MVDVPVVKGTRVRACLFNHQPIAELKKKNNSTDLLVLYTHPFFLPLSSTIKITVLNNNNPRILPSSRNSRCQRGRTWSFFFGAGIDKCAIGIACRSHFKWRVFRGAPPNAKFRTGSLRKGRISHMLSGGVGELVDNQNLPFFFGSQSEGLFWDS